MGAFSFNEKDIEEVSSGIRILDVIVGAPAIEIETIKPAAADGVIFTRQKYGTRPVDVLFAVVEENPIRRRNIFDALAVWSHSREEKKITIQNYAGFLMGICSSFPPVSIRNYGEILTISFRCSNPFFDTVSWNAVPYGTPFINTGFPSMSWKIKQTITDTLTNPTWDFGNEQIAFSVLTPGELEIDGQKQTATLNGNSVLPALLLGSRFFTIQPGQNTLDVQNGAGGTFYWRKRWI